MVGEAVGAEGTAMKQEWQRGTGSGRVSLHILGAFGKPSSCLFLLALSVAIAIASVADVGGSATGTNVDALC